MKISSQHLQIPAILVLVGTVLLISGCAPSFEVQYTRSYNWGWSCAEAQVIQNHFASFYLPHVQALQAAEQKILNGSDIRESVGGLDKLPGVRGVVVVSTDPSKTFTLPSGILPTGTDCQKIVSDSMFYRTMINPAKKSLPIHNCLLGGWMKYRDYLLKTPSGHEWLLFGTIQPDSTDSSTRISIAYILDINWIIAQIPAQMDSLMRENRPLCIDETHPAMNLTEQDIVIKQKYIDSGADSSKVIWASKYYEGRPIPSTARIWPFFDELTISVAVVFKNGKLY